MLLCLGSVVWTVASEAHWLPQAETKRQMVVVCVVYCDCDLTALLYLLLEVCVCSCAQLSACLHKQMHLCHDKERDAETLRTQLSLLSLSLSWVPADGFPLSLNRRANTAMALHAAIPDTKQCWNLITVSFSFFSVDGNIVIRQSLNSTRLRLFVCFWPAGIEIET